MSRRTSKSASAERRATSRRAVFTVALRPSVPSAACAAASAAWSTSTVVRTISIMVSHQGARPSLAWEWPRTRPDSTGAQAIGVDRQERCRHHLQKPVSVVTMARASASAPFAALEGVIRHETVVRHEKHGINHNHGRWHSTWFDRVEATMKPGGNVRQQPTSATPRTPIGAMAGPCTPHPP